VFEASLWGVSHIACIQRRSGGRPVNLRTRKARRPLPGSPGPGKQSIATQLKTSAPSRWHNIGKSVPRSGPSSGCGSHHIFELPVSRQGSTATLLGNPSRTPHRHGDAKPRTSILQFLGNETTALELADAPGLDHTAAPIVASSCCHYRRATHQGYDFYSRVLLMFAWRSVGNSAYNAGQFSPAP